MGAQLNIKSQEARDLAVRLATLTGESLTEAVTRALRETVQREEAKPTRKTPDEIAQQIREVTTLVARIRAGMKPGDWPDDDEWLYDEQGLPK